MNATPFQWRDPFDIPPRELGAPSWQEELLANPEMEKGEADKLVAAIRNDRSSKLLPRFDLDNLDGEPPFDREWILPGFIPENEVTLFTGPGGAGKSLFAQQLATCVAARAPFLGLDTIRLPDDDANVVMYITAEDDDRELHRRQRNINAALGVGREALGDRLYLSSLRGRIGNELATFTRDGEIEKTATYHLLFDTIFEVGASVIILDNVAHLFAGNENDRGQVTRFVNLLYSIVRTWSVTIVLLGHPNKSGDSYSGSTAWLNAVRSQIEIARLTDDLGNEHDPDARVLTVGKANYARHGQRHPFRWHDFAFWHDDDLPDDLQKEYAALAKSNGENAAFLRCLAAATERKKAISENPGANFYGSVFPKMPEGKGYGKDAFDRAFHRLLAVGLIELDAKLWQRENYAWKYGIREVEKPPNAPTDPTHRPPPNYP
ncbi:MAG: AAA family ATPase [Tsuneonella sp.]